MKGTLYLIPNSLGTDDPGIFLPPSVRNLIPELRYFIVENRRNARRYLKRVDRSIDIDRLTFFELNKHTSPREIPSFLRPLHEGHSIGMISEAGLPGVADPGAQVVRLAHEAFVPVKPLTGPSSLMLALMASGLNGQSFRFTGYLPVKRGERIKAIKELEQRARKQHETQIFIETPYRNEALLEDILASCHGATNLCIAVDLTLDGEMIKTQPIGKWKKKKPALHKRPAVFLIGI